MKKLIFYGGLLAIICAIILRLGFLKIKFLEIKTDFVFADKKGVEQIFKPYLGENILFFKSEKLIKDVQKQNIEIGEVFVQKKLPQKIILEIKRRQAIGSILKDNQYFLFDRNNIIFFKQEVQPDLPIVDCGLQNIVIGSTIESEVVKVLVNLKNFGIRRLFLKENELILETNSGGTIILPKVNIEEKLQALQIMLSSFKIDGKAFVKIDLRFVKPVVTF